MGEKTKIYQLHPSKLATPDPYALVSPSPPNGFKEAVMTSNLFFADVLAKSMYATLVIAAFVFVSMLLLTSLH
jgi:hypothetical protein